MELFAAQPVRSREGCWSSQRLHDIENSSLERGSFMRLRQPSREYLDRRQDELVSSNRRQRKQPAKDLLSLIQIRLLSRGDD